jgi:hypothetical protein
LTVSVAHARYKWLRRVGWLVLIWTASVAVMGTAALFFRLVMNAVGLTI